MAKSTKLHDAPKTGLAIHGSNVALTTSRAVTSHLRKRYHEKYRGRFRFARSVFAFDLVLLVLALGLLVVNIALFAQPYVTRPIGLGLTLRANELIAATAMPVSATVRTTDGKTHEDVRLFWHLPSSVEIIRAEPPLAKDGSVLLGHIAPGEEQTSRLYVRIRSLPQTMVPFGFSIHEWSGGRDRIVTGSEDRLIVKSALTAAPAISAQAIVAGGSVPIIVANDGDLAAPAVVVRLTAKNGAPASHFAEEDQISIGDMKPYERRVVFLDVDPNAKGRIEFAWEVQDASRAVSNHTLNLDVATRNFFAITKPLQSTPGAASTDVAYDAAGPARLWVYHPLQDTLDGSIARTYDLSAGLGTLHIPLKTTVRTTDTSWSIVPFGPFDGKTVLGERLTGVLSTAFPFAAAARYYALTGDQLGIGPLPPRVGEITSYWIVWSVGPTDADLKDLSFTTTLGPGVTATGKFASQTPGDFQTDGSSVTWIVPSLPATGDSPATFAFEIRYRPSSSDRGKIPVLIQDSIATTIEVRSGLTLEAHTPEQDTNLSSDIQARGKGMVE